MLGAVTLLADYHGTLTVAEETLVQVRGVSGDTAGQPKSVTGPAADLVEKPLAGLEIASGHWRYGVSYFPIFTLQNIESGFDFTADHLGSLRVTWHEYPATVEVREDGGYGQINFTTIQPSAQPNAPPPPLQLLPPGQTIYTVSSKTTVRSILTLAPHVRVITSTGFQLAGGTDAASQATLPLQKGPVVEAVLDYELGLKHFITAFNGSGTHSSQVTCLASPGSPPTLCTPEADLLILTEELRGRLAPKADAYVNAGAAFLRSRQQAEDAYGDTAYVVGGAGLVAQLHARPDLVSVRVSTLLAPLLSQQTGVVEERINGDGSLEWTHRRLTLSGLGRLAQTIPASAPGAAFFLHAELGATYAATKLVRVTLGARADWQQIEVGSTLGTLGAPGTKTLSAVGFFSIAVGEVKKRRL